MSSYRIIKRGVLFGIDGDNLTREGVTGTVEGTVNQSGQSVAVLFGTRSIDPVVVAWGSAGNRIVNYYDPARETSTVRPISDTNRTMRMVNLTVRMVLCVGHIDEFSSWTAGGVLFRAFRAPLPSGSSPRWIAYNNMINNGAVRFEVAVGDIDLFGGGEAGGLGFPFDRHSYDNETQYSQFFYSSVGNVTDNQLDANVEYRGVSLLYFRLFNFGGNLPPPTWKTTATRIDKLTTRNDRTNVYQDQWQPRLATIRNLPFRESAIYYLFVLSQSLIADQRTQVSQYIRAMPFDTNTTYQFLILSRTRTNATLVSGPISSVFTSRADALTWLDNNYTNETIRNYASNFEQSDVTKIVQTYAARMESNLTALRQERGVVAIFATDVFGGVSASWRSTGGLGNQSLTNVSLTGVAVLMSVLNNPIVPQGDLSIVGDPLAGRQRQKEAVAKSPADVRLALFKYRAAALLQPNVYVLAPNPYSFINKFLPSDTVGSTGFSPYQRFESVDAYNNPIVIGGAHPSVVGGTFRLPVADFVKQFRTILPVGRSMNPIHALRETLTNKSWGKGIDESLIDDTGFLLAANTCYNEKLDFCYLHKSIDPNPIVKLINDYVDGITYYNPALNKVTIKLIRNDYSIGDLPSFDETSIAMVSNFKRQQANRLVNSVTVKYHDVSLGTDETVTIQDLESTAEQRAAKTANLSLLGCATREAAARVAARELSALSKSVISCTVNINPSQPLGLGDPIVISYRDLGLARVVMRVAQIDYGTGLTGGFDVQLIQDVFSTPYYTDLVGEVMLPEPVERLADLPDVIKFLELSATDLSTVTNPFVAPNQQARYFKLGRKDDPLTNDSTVVTYNGQSTPVLIGTLLTPILSLTTSPVNSSLTLFVQIPDDQRPFGSHIRIDDEIMTITGRGVISPTVQIVTVSSRAVNDTVAVPHAVGTDVYFIDRMTPNLTPWDGAPITVQQTQDGLVDTAQLSPDITFIQRGSLPLPPAWVTVDGKYIPNLIINGNIVVRYQARLGSLTSDLITIRLTKGDTQLYYRSIHIPAIVGDAHPIQTQTITASSLSSQLSTGTHDLEMSVFTLATDGTTTSWQSWNYRIDWSATVREREGWNFNYGNNWGSGRAATIIDGQPTFARGWDFDFDENWDV